MTSESRIAFYKATKFWLVFLLALLLAAVIWRVFVPAERNPVASVHGSFRADALTAGCSAGLCRTARCARSRPRGARHRPVLAGFARPSPQRSDHARTAPDSASGRGCHVRTDLPERERERLRAVHPSNDVGERQEEAVSYIR